MQVAKLHSDYLVYKNTHFHHQINTNCKTVIEGHINYVSGSTTLTHKLVSCVTSYWSNLWTIFPPKEREAQSSGTPK